MADLRERQSVHRSLTRLQNKVNALTAETVTAAELKVHLDEADRLRVKAEDAHKKIIQACTTDDAHAVQQAALDEIEDCFFDTRTKLLALQFETGTQLTRARPVQVKLPDMPLPTFEGRYEDWPTFSDLFVATIDKNSSLSPSQKLQYLKSCTKGEAANLIRTFTVTDANYVEAWELLESQYNNRREIVHSLIKKLLFQPALKTESASSLQQLLNTTLESIRSLRVLGRPTDQWDDLLCVLIIEKMDCDTKSEWARSLVGTDPPIFEEITDFLTRHIRTLHAKGSIKSAANKQQNQQIHQKGNRLQTHHTTISSCQHCKGQHQLFQCAKLRDLPHDKRVAAIRAAKVCYNCLGAGHISTDCRSGTCKKCDKRHHTLLHPDKQSNNHEDESTASNTLASSSSKKININNTTILAKPAVLLKTAVVDVLDMNGTKMSLRLLLDDGGEGCLVRESIMFRLGLKKERVKVTVSGVGDLPAMQSRWLAFATLFSQVNNASVDVKLYSVPRVTGKVNQLKEGDARTWRNIAGLQLADPHFYEGGDIDILLGSDVVPYLLKTGLKKLDQTAPVAQETIFGWVLSGNVGSPSQSSFRIHNYQCEVSQALRLFWEIEEVPHTQPFTMEEEKCERHFITTHTRLPNGRYMVRLPFNEKKDQLGGSKDQAFRRLRALEKRFEKQPQFKSAYVEFMREYETLGHMELVEFTPKKVNTSFYLPHHFVLKEDSTTTKQRTVFDGSAKSTSGVSLNDILMVGPTVQPDLYSLLIRFRYNPIALKADIEKMFRNFGVHPDDRDYQRILWRENSIDLVKEYRLTTVTYGTGSAPYQATRCLNQLAEDEGSSFPAAAEALLTSTYVDDYLGSSSSTEAAIELVSQLIKITEKAGMKIRKWCSNSKEVLQCIPEHLQEECPATDFGESSTPGSIKALGIKWQPTTDDFIFTVQLNTTSPISKRVLLSETSKTFDPLGWLSPVTIRAKLLLQRVWVEGHGWDEPVSEPVQADWSLYVADLEKVTSLKIPRCVIKAPPETVELHGYSDSSELAYSCSVYLKCRYDDGSTSVNLLTSRTKVAPIKSVSLPKLELCGAKLLAETMDAIKKTITFPYNMYCWTDSTITLRWITAPSRKWKTFVANRVSTIQSLVPPECWGHVRSADNPADLPSRRIEMDQLINSDLWWHGPTWLQGENYPKSTTECDEEEVKEAKSKALACFHVAPYSAHSLLFNAFSSFTKLLRCAIYLMRFAAFTVDKKSTNTGPLTAAEFHAAKMGLIRWAQKASFMHEIKSLKKTSSVSSSSKLASLNPFIDSNGVLRVGGRIQKSALPEKSRHPVILAHDHPLTALIISYFHLNHLHSGFTLTHAAIRSEYWILRGRSTIRYHIRKCVTCRRHSAFRTTLLMGNLPLGRVRATRAFLHCGVDFAGPFRTKIRRGKHPIMEKTYFCIFVCLSTKAVHLEAVTSLSSEAFIACYERFVSRRGVPSHIYSDCGTNFVGADKILQSFLLEQSKCITGQAAERGTTWIFNPPAAPHQGGLWEAGVKSVKKHFYRVIGDRTLLLEEFQTLLCKIEACLNSRPLCAVSADPDDYEALTPGHFLIGEPLKAIPEPDLTMTKESHLKQWELVRLLSQHFWRRWRNEYLTSLQQRHKWTTRQDNLHEGELVVVADDQMPPAKWKLGRIIATHSGEDGLVRKATVKTAFGELKRPITKLNPLIFEN